jgi:hypothetical protein
MCFNTHIKGNLVLDLDETLIHTIVVHINDHSAIQRYVCKKNLLVMWVHGEYMYIVFYRPHLFSFLKNMSKNFNIYVYTNGTESYCNMIVATISTLMGEWLIKASWFRVTDGPPPKFLHNTGLNINNTIIVDDRAEVWALHYEKNNVMHIYQFKGPSNDDYLFDTELIIMEKCLLKLFMILCEDVTNTNLSHSIPNVNISYRNRNYLYESVFSSSHDSTIIFPALCTGDDVGDDIHIVTENDKSDVEHIKMEEGSNNINENGTQIV